MMQALIEAGANIDSRRWDRATSLFVAAAAGQFDAVCQLLRANANPQLTATNRSGIEFAPLDVAAEREVARAWYAS